jgi:PAS domain S-box-containing protein
MISAIDEESSAATIRSLKRDLAMVQQQFYAIIDASKNGILAVDSTGMVIIANREVGEILGLELERIIGQPIVKLIPNTLLLEILKTREPLLGQKITVNRTVVMANYAPIISEGVLVGAISVFQDISILESTFSELNLVRGLVQEQEAVIKSSYDGIFITDANGVVLRLNEAYERMTGIKPADVVGKSMKQLVKEKYYDQSVTLLVIEKRERITINQIVKGDRRLLVTGNPVFDDAGNLFRIVTNVRDVTDLTNLQDQLITTKNQTLKYKTELSHLRLLQMEENEIIFRSRSMAQAISAAVKIADVDSSVLITGDSGTGKELIAKMIHRKGKGVSLPFIKINCAAFPEQLLESELFGYEGGAFTGAKKEGKPGMFELANNGTLFLDEIGDMPLVLQVKLLRVLQEKEVLRVGGIKPVKVNVRIIGATNRDLLKEVEAGGFRRDLYYRLMVVPIHLVPLRERREDIPPLLIHFLDEFSCRYSLNRVISTEAMDRLVDYSWPGNVRELKNVVERMVVTSSDSVLTIEHLPDDIRRKSFHPKRGVKLRQAVEETESVFLAETFAECKSWNKVAEVLGIDKTTVYRKASKYGLLMR